ncbi:lytic murein transglycosylase [Lentibacter algarum]|uniref:lytic murein transglycosylase n=1 Tax=Lentibacter algarum TaxID=576131 RepID=UPI001C09AD54|nr:lytic murein transglycosylase [Lentibacter algarum]MBU2983583.1 lytic murein transglycosylase [Lentibacter algarum]
MPFTRRTFLAIATAFTATPTFGNTGYTAWLAGFQKRAARSGISQKTLSTAFAKASFLPKVVASDSKQAEVAKSLQQYLSSAASPQRVSGGRKALKRYKSLLGNIERKYGVEKEVVVAIWGMESAYGGFRGSASVFATLSTLAYQGRRRELFEAELLAALKILQSGQASAAQMKGSYAGAMGHTQFMPSTYLRHAQDFDKNGRANIWSDDPTDALASTAALLKAEGWKKGQPWALEVRLPDGFNPALTGRIYPRKAREWMKLGLRAANGNSLPNHGNGAVILPAGPEGPAFMIYKNFHVLKKYNYADSYVIGVGHLSDTLAGHGKIRSGFPKNPWGMTNAERRTLQQRLNARGFAAGNPDGVIGEKGRAAIRAYEQSKGLALTGTPSKALLNSLK